MGSMHRILRFNSESVAGTRDAAAVEKHYVRCDAPNIMSPMMQPKFWTVMDGSGLNEPALRGVASIAVGATCKIRLCASQAQFFMSLCAQKITAAPLPWPTDQRLGDLASCTVDFGWSYDNLAMKRQGSLGCKVASWRLETQASESDPFLYLTMNLVGMVTQGNTIDSSIDPDATVFPEPALIDLPSDYYQIQHSNGHVTMAGVGRTKYKSLVVAGDNLVKPYYDSGYFANRVRSHGRKQTLNASILLENGLDRALYESGGSAGSTSVQFSRGTNSMTLNFHSGNYVDGVKEDLVLDDDNYYDLSLSNFLNAGATGLDMTFV